MIKSNIEDYLKEHGEIVITPSGTSMWPMLRHKRDLVYFTKNTGRLKKYDLPIYKRANGQLVTHRVIEVNQDSYTMCGDHQTVPEHGITDEQIIAVAKGFYRGEKYISCDNKWYVRYYKFWCRSLRLRKIMLFIPDTAARIFRKMKSFI